VVHLSPRLREVEPYPFEVLDRRKAEALEAGRTIVDFGVGDPREETPAIVRDALVDAIGPISSYPRAAGLPRLRRAIAAWVQQRYGVPLDPDTQVLPTLGSKELVFSLPQAALDPAAGRDLVLTTAPGYPITERGARYAGGEVLRLPLTEANGFLPDLEAIPEDTWRRAAILWVNYPNNPTGAVAPLSFFERLAELALEHDFLVCSDEAYSELWFTAPPCSAFQVGDRTNVVVFQTLSKRSSMTGYRSGFVGASPQLISALKTYRPSTGAAPQEFVQRASVVAWSDEQHVERTREAYRRKRNVFLPVLAAKGWRVAASEATMYLWVEVPGGESSEAAAERLLEHGIVLAPGSYLGAAGEGYVRLALVPTLAECERAAAILEEVL
jgi:succinyldiaminopimelate transaminase